VFIYAEGFDVKRCIWRWYSATWQEEEEAWFSVSVVLQEERKVVVTCRPPLAD